MTTTPGPDDHSRYASARRIFDAVKRDGHRVLTLPEIQRVIDAHTAADTPDNGRLWAVTVTIPADIDEGDRDDLFDLIADTAHKWEPEGRDGWDIDVSAGPRGHTVTLPTSDPEWPEWLTPEHNNIHAAFVNAMKEALAHCYGSADVSGYDWTMEGLFSVAANSIMSDLRRAGCPPPAFGITEPLPMPVDEHDYSPGGEDDDNLTIAEVVLWTCPDCAFSFDAEHIDVGGGYSCPVCAETRLAAEVDALRRALGTDGDDDE